MEAEKRPAAGNREASQSPSGVARLLRQAVAQAKAEKQARGVMHQVIEINAIKTGSPAPSGHLSVDVVEPEGEMSQEDPQDKPKSIS